MGEDSDDLLPRLNNWTFPLNSRLTEYLIIAQLVQKFPAYSPHFSTLTFYPYTRYLLFSSALPSNTLNVCFLFP